MNTNKTNILFIIFVILLFVAGFFIYTNLKEGSLGSVSVSAERVLGKEFVATIGKIKTIRIDTAFFDSSEFNALIDLTPVIELPEEIGRTNPFLPL
ncbi:MAG: hypothetical protein ABII97_01545 [Patescibacteria group bacterium]